MGTLLLASDMPVPVPRSRTVAAIFSTLSHQSTVAKAGLGYYELWYNVPLYLAMVDSNAGKRTVT